ncbi:MAG: hypothetical protein AAFN81_13410 [Bacteroidota bacterium]
MEFRSFLGQLLLTIGRLPRAVMLIQERELWRGVNRYGWVVKVLVIVAIFMSLSFLSQVMGWVGGLSQADSGIAALSSVGTLASNMALQGYESFTSGLLKYVILLLSEVIIFHFMQRALEELRGHPVRTDFQAFFQAQVRMFKVVIRVYILELIATVALNVFFGIFGFLDWLEPITLFLVQCYFFGLVIIDNYNEQFGMNIKDSMAFSRNYRGVSLALGFVLYLCMLVPLVGVVAGTILVSVTAVLVLNQIADVELDSPVVEPANPSAPPTTE